METLLTLYKDGGPLAQYIALVILARLVTDLRKVKRRLGIVERRTKHVQPITDSFHAPAPMR